MTTVGASFTHLHAAALSIFLNANLFLYKLIVEESYNKNYNLFCKTPWPKPYEQQTTWTESCP